MTAEVVLTLTAEDSAGRLAERAYRSAPAVALGTALGDDKCVAHGNTS